MVRKRPAPGPVNILEEGGLAEAPLQITVHDRLLGNVEKLHGHGQALITGHEGLKDLDLDEVMLRVVVHLPHKDQLHPLQVIHEFIKRYGFFLFKINDPPLRKVPPHTFNRGKGRHGWTEGATPAENPGTGRQKYGNPENIHVSEPGDAVKDNNLDRIRFYHLI